MRPMSLSYGWRVLLSHIQSFADRAMAFGSLIISGFVALVCLALAIESVKPLSPASIPVVAACVLGIAASTVQIGYVIAAMVTPRLPAALQVALAQPSWPCGLRWLFATWWIGHFAFGVFLAIGLLEAEVPEVGAVILFSLMSMAFTYAAFGFVMLAITCYSKQPDLILRVWGWRAFWSGTHGVVTLVAGGAKILLG